MLLLLSKSGTYWRKNSLLLPHSNVVQGSVSLMSCPLSLSINTRSNWVANNILLVLIINTVLLRPLHQ